MRHPVLVAFIAIAVVAIGGLSFYGLSGKPDAGLVPLDQLPTGFLDSARKQLPHVKFDKAWKLSNGNYEIRGKDAKGKVREVELNSNGELVEVD
jgi:hypothetical protein